MTKYVYKIVSQEIWEVARGSGEFAGAEIDLVDGFIHFSDAGQVRETARRHFAGQPDLLLIEVDPQPLGHQLKWEPSRGGDLFPHLYGILPLEAVTRVSPLPLDEAGEHVWPDDLS